MRRYVAVPLLITAVMVLMAVSAQTSFARSAVIRVSSSKGIDRAVRVAKAKGHGATVYFRAGSYSHKRMTWPSGIKLRGDGIGRTKLNFAIQFGSRSVIGGRQSAGLTIGSSQRERRVQLQERRAQHELPERPLSQSRFHAVEPVRLHPQLARPSGQRRRQRPQHRLGRLRVRVHRRLERHDLQRLVGRTPRRRQRLQPDLEGLHLRGQEREWSVRLGRIGLLIQPSPPEHAADGPRPGSATSTPNFHFDLSKITHGSGQAAIGGAHGYGFRIWNSSFVGRSSFNSFDLCDYVRAWAMVAHHLTQSSQVTRAMVAAAPARFTTKGVSLRNVWMAGGFTKEYGRNVKLYRVRTQQGAAYHVPAIVRKHDRQLYGS